MVQKENINPKWNGYTKGAKKTNIISLKLSVTMFSTYALSRDVTVARKEHKISSLFKLLKTRLKRDLLTTEKENKIKIFFSYIEVAVIKAVNPSRVASQYKDNSDDTAAVFCPNWEVHCALQWGYSKFFSICSKARSLTNYTKVDNKFTTMRKQRILLSITATSKSYVLKYVFLVVKSLLKIFFTHRSLLSIHD